MTPADIMNVLGQFWILWLFVFFGLIVFVAYRPKNRRLYDECANIPFHHDSTEEN